MHSLRPFRSTAALTRRFFRFALVFGAVAVLHFATGCSAAPNLLAPLSIASFLANPSTVTLGQSSILTWSVAGAQSLQITDGSTVLTTSQLTPLSANSVSVTPAATTTYILTAVDPNGNSTTAATTVTVVPAPSIQSFSASPTIISNNQSSTLTWTVANAATLSIDNGVGYVTGNSVNVSPTGTTTYTLTAANAAGTQVQATATVSVVLAPSILSFTANPPTVGVGLPSTLSWSVIGATSLSLDNGIGTVTGSSINVTPTQTTTYRLTAYNTLGSFTVSTTAAVTVQVSTVPPPTIDAFNVSVPSAGAGAEVTLTAVFIPTDGSATATIDQGVGPVSSGVPVDTSPLTVPTTFTLTVTNATGSVSAQQRVIVGSLEVYAGSPTNPGSADGTGKLAHFNQPYGLASDSAGNIYVADTGNDVIRKIAPGGIVTTFAGTDGVAGSSEGTGPTVQFNAPSGVAVDAAGNVYVADSGNGTIRVLTPSGTSRTLAGTPQQFGDMDGTGGNAEFAGIQGIALDANANVYVTDALNCNIREVTPQGVVTTIAGPSSSTCGNADGVGAAALFNSPNGIALDASGNIYVADQNNNTIRKIASGTFVVSTFAGSTRGTADGQGAAANFYSPTGLASDPSGNLYVCDSSYTIRKVDPSANVTTIVGHAKSANPQLTGGPLPSTITSPHGIVADPVSGNLFVSYSVSAITSSPF
jgi:sugar lactone lactonase YvrE